MMRTLGRLAIAVGLIVAALVVFWPGIHGDFFFDSLPNIVYNPAIQITDLDFATLRNAALSFTQGPLGRPLPMLSFALNWYAGGADPYWFKLVNLLIHGINAVLVYALVRRLLVLQGRLGGASGPHPERIAALAALLWAIAPIHGFTVVYVVQRMVLLGALFTLLALHAWLGLRAALAAGAALRALGFAGLLGLAALASLACKETAVLLPFYIAAAEWFLFRGEGLGRLRGAYVSALLFLVLAPVLAFAYVVWQDPAGFYRGYEIRSFGPGERVLTQARVLVMYLRNVLVPDYGQFHFFYDNLPVSHSLTQPLSTALSLAFWAALTAAGIILRRRAPLVGFAVFWFLAGHLLESSFWSLELVFWHRNYLPALGPLVALAAGCDWLIRRSGGLRLAGFGLTGIFIVLFAFQSRLIATDWSDRVAIARAEVIKNPGSSRASHYYGRMAVITGELNNDPALFAEAEKFFRRALAQDPRVLHPLTGLIYLAVVHRHGDLPAALAEMKRRVADKVPEIGDAAAIEQLPLFASKNPDRPDVQEFQDVLAAAAANRRLLPDQRAAALVSEARLLSHAGRPAAVFLPLVRQALTLMPDSLEYRSVLFRTLIDVGELDEAAAVRDRQPFTARDRLREPLLPGYEEKLKVLLETRETARRGPGGAGGGA